MLDSTSLCSTCQSHASGTARVRVCVCGGVDRACESWARAEISHTLNLSLKWTCAYTQTYILSCWLVSLLLTRAHSF